MQAVKLEELTFQDAEGKQSFKVRDINWEDWPKKKNIQLVMDPGGMKMQLQLACDALEKKKRLSKGRYKPLLFVIAPSIMGARKAVEMMKDDFNLNPLLVVGEIDDATISSDEKKALRGSASSLGELSSEYDSVVSVYMLREGWDVPEVSVMCLLRGFGSPLFAHQVLGRGLRLIRKNGLAKDRSIQELTIIDHHCLDLDDLWAEIDALVQEGDEITRNREIPRNGDASIDIDNKDKRPEQIIVRPNLYKLLQAPSPKAIRGISSERALEILEIALEKIKDHRMEKSVMITGSEADSIERLRPKRQIERMEKYIKVTAIPKNTGTDRELIQRQFTKMVMEWAREYSETYLPLFIHNDEIYRTILRGFENHIFGGQSITEVESHILYAAQNIIPQFKEAVAYEMNFRIYSEEVLNNG